MTQKLEELFNLPPADSTTPEEAKSNIEEQRAINIGFSFFWGSRS